MDLNYLKNFVAIVDAKSISAASRELLIAQPALSYQIKALEQHYGAALIIRGPRQITLTEAGYILYERAKNILFLENGALASIADCVAGDVGALHYGMMPSQPDFLLDSLFLAFHAAYPRITFQSFERPSNEIFKFLADGIVEIIIFRIFDNIYQTLNPDLDILFTIDERIMLYYSNDNPWIDPGQSSIPISALKGIPLSVSKSFKERITYACLKEGFSPNFFSVSTTREAARIWAKNGAAIVINSGNKLVAENGYGCCFLDGENVSIKLVFAVLKKKRLSAVTQTFIEFCKKYLGITE